MKKILILLSLLLLFFSCKDDYDVEMIYYIDGTVLTPFNFTVNYVIENPNNFTINECIIELSFITFNTLTITETTHIIETTPISINPYDKISESVVYVYLGLFEILISMPEIISASCTE